MDKLLNKKMFFTSGDMDGCGYIRSKLPAEYLQQKYNLGFPVNDPRIKDSDIIFIQRATSPYFIEYIPKLQALGKKIVYDIDDNLWEISSFNPAYRPYNSEMLKTTANIMKLCDAIVVSTQPLKDYFASKKFNKNIHVIPNFLKECKPYRELNNDVITIGYAGTATHAGDFDVKLIQAVRKILDQYDNVEVSCFGYNPFPEKNHPKIKFTEFVETDKYYETLYNLNIDIGIMPLANNEFNRGKSNLKFLEYSNCSIATIAQNVYPYKNTISHMENGILIENNKEWIGYLDMLINNSTLRKKLAKNANEYVSNAYTFKNNGSYITSLYENLIRSIYE